MTNALKHLVDLKFCPPSVNDKNELVYGVVKPPEKESLKASPWIGDIIYNAIADAPDDLIIPIILEAVCRINKEPKGDEDLLIEQFRDTIAIREKGSWMWLALHCLWAYVGQASLEKTYVHSETASSFAVSTIGTTCFLLNPKCIDQPFFKEATSAIDVIDVSSERGADDYLTVMTKLVVETISL